MCEKKQKTKKRKRGEHVETEHSHPYVQSKLGLVSLLELMEVLSGEF